MHNSTPEYASNTTISTIMTMPFHVKPFEKKVFEEVIFLLKYHQTPQVLKRRSIEKREKSIEEKRGWKRKAPRVSSNKGEVNILRGEKHINFKNLLLMWFSPPSSYHFKTLSKIIEKVFLALFGPSFMLAIYMTWVVPFLLTHELHIFSL
jgi:hypothetical protein